MGQCNLCGKCCIAIALDYSLELLKHAEYVEADLLLDIWEPITKEEAYEINPYVKNIKRTKYFYKCSLYNQITKQCNDYENRPLICKNYPSLNNGKTSKNEIYYGEECGFKPKT